MRGRGQRRRRVVGTGLIVLDVTVGAVVGSNAFPAWTGGTCGNVLAILAFLGWTARAVGRVGIDSASACLVRDLLDSGVDASLLDREPNAGTPVILHRVGRDRHGNVRHGYSFACPQCERRYPSYRPLLVSRVPDLAALLEEADVFFFDRASRGVLDLACRAHEVGALVVFEPSASTEAAHMVEAVRLSDIVKYARDRRPKFEMALNAALSQQRPWLEIETRGADGLAYRLRADRRWTTRSAPFAPMLRDASGAGDWLTAGLVHALVDLDMDRPTDANHQEVEAALALGEALAAFNCQFEGPRGAMYAGSKDSSVAMLAGVDARLRRRLRATTKRPPLQMTLTGICAVCAAASPSGPNESASQYEHASSLAARSMSPTG